MFERSKPEAAKVRGRHYRTNPGLRRAGGRPFDSRAVLGALDLGTNNCRLLVATPNPGGFRVIDAFSKIVRLGENLATGRMLTEAAIERSIDALKICAEKLKKRGATRTRSVATEACRLAENSSGFVERVREETGLALDVISSEEEARLAVMGCKALFDSAADYILVFDVGGGSTEVTFVEKLEVNSYQIVEMLSLPYGVVRLAEEADGHSDAIAFHEEVRETVKARLAEFQRSPRLKGKIDGAKIQLIGSSGTVTTMAAVSLGLQSYIRSEVDGSTINSGEMLDLARRTATMSKEERAAIPCVGEDRADLLVPGCAILEAILETWQKETLTVADRGVREGILRSLLPHSEAAVDLAWERLPEAEAVGAPDRSSIDGEEA